MFQPFVTVELPSGIKIVFKKLKRKDIVSLTSSITTEEVSPEERMKKDNEFILKIADKFIIDGVDTPVTHDVLDDLYMEDYMAIVENMQEVISGKKK